eukprot:2342270-Amphidinium_carterae.1
MASCRASTATSCTDTSSCALSLQTREMSRLTLLTVNLTQRRPYTIQILTTFIYIFTCCV